jgi:3-hydroxybutyryl-CoA dehydrogenase
MTEERAKGAAVIGGGTMGGDIAAIFAAGGWVTHIVEPAESVRKNLPMRLKDSLKTLNTPDAQDRIRIYDVLDRIPWNAIGMVVECVPEVLAAKQSVFKRLEALSPAGTPLTSNSSSFPISHIGKGLSTQARMAGLHFFMPAHLVPLVEVIRSEQTDPEITDTIGAVMRQLGKRPVQVKRDIPGFLANRLQHALMREVLHLVESGIASIEDVDASVRYGFGLRYLAAGPLLQKDLSGVDIHSAAAESIYPDLCNATHPSRFMTDMIAAGRTGVKAKEGFYAWTDEEIAVEKARYAQRLLAALDILNSDAGSAED